MQCFNAILKEVINIFLFTMSLAILYWNNCARCLENSAT